MYLIIYSATGYFKEKNYEKYFIIDSRKEYKQVFSEIISKIKTSNGGEKMFYEEKYTKIGINTDDDIPLNKQLKFPTLTIIIRYVFQKGKKLYPQIYLYECLYELQKCCNTIKLMLQKKLTLTKQVNQNNIKFVINGFKYK